MKRKDRREGKSRGAVEAPLGGMAGAASGARTGQEPRAA